MSDTPTADIGLIAACIAAIGALWAAFRGDAAASRKESERLLAENTLLRDRLQKTLVELAESRVRDEYEHEELRRVHNGTDRVGGRGDREGARG